MSGPADLPPRRTFALSRLRARVGVRAGCRDTGVDDPAEATLTLPTPASGRGRAKPTWARRALLAALLPALAGCGWAPLYAERGPGGDIDPALAGVRVQPIADRAGQLLAISLRDGFNPNGAEVPSRYNLLVRLST